MAPLEPLYSAEAWGRLELTNRQTECAQLILMGLSRPEIANELGISVSTLDKHFAAIKKALDVSSMNAVIAKLHAVLSAR